MRGTDAVAVLHKLCSNDIAGLQLGEGREAFVCTVQGKTLAHIWAFRAEDGLLIDTVAGQGDTLIAHLDRYIIREDVQLENQSDQVTTGLLVGPASLEVLANSWPELTPPSGVSQVAILGAAADAPQGWVRRLPWGDDTLQLVLPPMIAATGRSLADHADLDAWNAYRIELGLPLFGQDISDTNLPQEVGRDEHAISFEKGCYLGQETVARIDAMGHVNRHLCGLRFDAAARPEPGQDVSAAGKVVGQLTSVCHSPLLQAPLALAYVRREHAVPGARLECPAGEAEVVALPLPPARSD